MADEGRLKTTAGVLVVALLVVGNYLLGIVNPAPPKKVFLAALRAEKPQARIDEAIVGGGFTFSLAGCTAYMDFRIDEGGDQQKVARVNMARKLNFSLGGWTESRFPSRGSESDPAGHARSRKGDRSSGCHKRRKWR